jgi:pimeloyl-ACP methyl ester carboxylesterase
LFSEGHVDVGGVAIRYSQGGQGPPLIHLQAIRHLTPAHDLLGRRFRVIVMEVPGSGRAPEAAVTIGRAIENLGLGDFDLMATPAASPAALRLALQEPERVRALVLESPTLLGGDGAEPRDADLEPRLAEVGTPMLVVFGTRDREGAQATGRIYAKRMPNAHLVFVYDAAHPLGDDRPEAFAEVVADFLDRHEAFIINRAATVIHP